MTCEAEMNLQTAEIVRRELRSEPELATEIAARAGVPIHEAYRALVWLYDRGMARIGRYRRTGLVSGWEAM